MNFHQLLGNSKTIIIKEHPNDCKTTDFKKIQHTLIAMYLNTFHLKSESNDTTLN